MYSCTRYGCSRTCTDFVRGGSEGSSVNGSEGSSVMKGSEGSSNERE